MDPNREPLFFRTIHLVTPAGDIRRLGFPSFAFCHYRGVLNLSTPRYTFQIFGGLNAGLIPNRKMAEEPFFKIRPTKRSNPESRTTLDRLHHVRMQTLLEKEGDVDTLKAELEALGQQTSADEIESERLLRKQAELAKEIGRRLDKNEIFDYFLNTGEILYNYYEIQDKISNGTGGPQRRAPAKPGSVLAALESAAGTSPQPGTSPKGEVLRRDKLLEEYLQKVDPEHARGATVFDQDPYGECGECGTEMIFSANEALFTCVQCGAQEFVLIDSDKPSYKDPPREVSYYAYKRINHFNEWLAQFQAKESTEIPPEVYDAILAELKKERIMDFRTLKQSKVREILKKLKYNKYYEHVPHIMNRLNGQTAPVMSREIEEKLRYMFKEIQPSFQKNCPKERSNFLSYSYVLYKFCELLELDEYLTSFPLLKNRDKLYVQDKIWELICKDLSWQFIKSL
jgi:predicted  nucleic acid-binding Zn-ribbon protein